MLRLLLTVSVAVFSVVATNSPSTNHLFRVFRDLPQFGTQPPTAAFTNAHGRRLERHAHRVVYDDDDTSVRLEYNAVHHSRHTLALLGPAFVADITAIWCDPAQVRVVFSSAAAANRLVAHAHEEEDFVSGVCTQRRRRRREDENDDIDADLDDGENPNGKPFYRRVAAAARLSRGTVDGMPGMTVVVATSDARFEELCDEIDLEFKWSPPKDKTTGKVEPRRPSKTFPAFVKTARAEAEAAEARAARVARVAKVAKAQKAAAAVSAASAASSTAASPTSKRGLFLDKIGDFFNDIGDKIKTGVIDKAKDVWADVKVRVGEKEREKEREKREKVRGERGGGRERDREIHFDVTDTNGRSGGSVRDEVLLPAYTQS